MRHQIYKDSVQFIKMKNSNETQTKEGLTYQLGVNKFADWTKEERLRLVRGIKREERIKRDDIEI